MAWVWQSNDDLFWRWANPLKLVYWVNLLKCLDMYGGAWGVSLSKLIISLYRFQIQTDFDCTLWPICEIPFNINFISGVHLSTLTAIMAATQHCLVVVFYFIIIGYKTQGAWCKRGIYRSPQTSVISREIRFFLHRPFVGVGAKFLQIYIIPKLFSKA